MIKKKIELDDKVETLAEKYAQLTDKNLDEIINEALKCYLVNQLGSSQVRRALKEDDSESNTVKILDHMLSGNLDNLNRY